jgi:hypothetical protein
MEFALQEHNMHKQQHTHTQKKNNTTQKKKKQPRITTHTPRGAHSFARAPFKRGIRETKTQSSCPQKTPPPQSVIIIQITIK